MSKLRVSNRGRIWGMSFGMTLGLLLSAFVTLAYQGPQERRDSLEQLAQTTTKDSLRFATYQKLVVAYMGVNNDKAKGYCRKLIKIGEDLDDEFYKAVGYSRYSIFLTVDGVLDSALMVAHNAYASARQSTDIMAEARAEHALGWYYAMTGNYLLALEYYEKSVDKYEILKESNGIRSTYTKIGLLYKQMGEYDKAVELLLEMISRFPDQSLFVFNLASAYESLEDDTSAERYYRKYLDMTSDRPENYQRAKAQAAIYRIQGNTALEKERREYVIAEVDRIGKPMMIHSEAQMYAAFLLRNNEYHKAIELLESRRIIDSDKIKQAHKLRYYDLLKSAYEGKGDYQKALHYSDLQRELNEQYQKRHNLDRVIDREKNLEFAAKEKMIKSLQVDQKSKSKKINLLQISVISILCLLALSLFLFLKNKKTNSTLILQNEKLDRSLEEKQTLIQETHHRVKNNLQIISSLLNLQRKYVDDKQMNGILTNSRNRVKSMALIHQMLYQNELSYGIDAQKYIKTLTDSLLSSYHRESDHINVILSVSEVNLDEDTINPIGLIINELVTNSIKYAFPDNQQGTIEVSLEQVGEVLILTVRDNGVGLSITDEPLELGFGHSLVHSLAKKLKASVYEDHSNGVCTRLTIRNFQLVPNSQSNNI